jgi:4-methyl-5(b-hydroxyethyl)-thiazole monophosphate biosynthesis
MLDKQSGSSKGLEMIVLPGGMPGTLNLEKSPVVTAYIDFALKHGLWIAAICAAPAILGRRGLLSGKRVTCHPDHKEALGEGAIYTGAAVEADGKLITASGAGAAVQFGLKLAECLRGEEKAAAISSAMQCK